MDVEGLGRRLLLTPPLAPAEQPLKTRLRALRQHLRILRRLFVTCCVFTRYFFVVFSWLFRGPLLSRKTVFGPFSWLFRGPCFGQILRVLALEQSSEICSRTNAIPRGRGTLPLWTGSPSLHVIWGSVAIGHKSPPHSLARPTAATWIASAGPHHEICSPCKHF